MKLVTQIRCAAMERDEVTVTRDISTGGSFINAQCPISIDSELSLRFPLYPTEPAITCRAKVIYSHIGLGMGIQILDLSEAATQSLQKFVDEVN
jgi:PilZ domain